MKKTKERIWFKCRRGMLELDLILSRFVQFHFDNLSTKQREDFDKLLTEQDPDLYSWLVGEVEPADEELREIVTTIRLQHHRKPVQ